ncbi:MAG: divalent-cation tolerance protein CutA [Alphaproteobacteria bacterium]|nr:divalent-cation tolerance protein CutA [Alphaproteobacteria bacterium]
MNIMIYVTYPSNEEAKTISKVLIEKKLVACANIFPAHETMYWWEGKVEEGSEIAVIYKTTKENFEAVKDAILKQHSYDCPCIVALPIDQAYEGFADWIKGAVL